MRQYGPECWGRGESLHPSFFQNSTVDWVRSKLGKRRLEKYLPADGLTKTGVSPRVSRLHHSQLEPEPINTLDYCGAVWPRNDCQLYQFPLVTKNRCEWVLVQFFLFFFLPPLWKEHSRCERERCDATFFLAVVLTDPRVTNVLCNKRRALRFKAPAEHFSLLLDVQHVETFSFEVLF